MAVSIKCNGWGLQHWGTDPWGGGAAASTPPTITYIDPPCGDTNVNPNTAITLTVCGGPCAYLKGSTVGDTIDCFKIWVNGTLVYDGTGLTWATINDGFKAPCNQSCSEVVGVITADPTDPTLILSVCLTFTLCCLSFGCDEVVTVAAEFCNNDGEIVSLTDCSFSTLPCNSIADIEIIDAKHIVLRFSNYLLPNPALNKPLYDPSSWTVMPVSGGAIQGNSVEVQNVLVEKTFLPKTIILETNTLSRGAMYEVVGLNTILDIHRQGLISKGKAMLITRKTKVDSIINRLPRMYKMSLNNSLEDNQRVISIWQIFAAIGIEDERMGGDY